MNNAYSATGWLKAKPAGGNNPSTIDDSVTENNAAVDLLLSTFTNCKISYSSASALSVSAGGVVVSNSTGALRLMLANTAATSVTFAGNLDTGSEAASTTYYVYAIGSATTDTTFTIKISTSATVPSGVTYYKRIGYFYNDGSSNITQIVNDDNSGDIAYVKGQGNYYKIDSGSGGSSISFSFTFASAPIVVIAPASDTGPDHWACNVDSVSTTGFTSYFETVTSIKWIAIGQVLAQ